MDHPDASESDSSRQFDLHQTRGKIVASCDRGLHLELEIIIGQSQWKRRGLISSCREYMTVDQRRRRTTIDARSWPDRGAIVAHSVRNWEPLPPQMMDHDRRAILAINLLPRLDQTALKIRQKLPFKRRCIFSFVLLLLIYS